MNRRLQRLIGSFVLCGSLLTAAPHYPFPQHVVYSEGTIKPSNVSQERMDRDVERFYNRWKRDYLVSAGRDAKGHRLYRIAYGKGSNTTVSEGQGYGMVIVALMAGYDPRARRYFDGLWRYARKYPSINDPRLMAWKIRKGHPVEGRDSAFDGDTDIAFGLLLAAQQWGTEGGIDYLKAARRVIRGIRHSTIGPHSRLPKLGDWVEDDGDTYNEFTPRSSDFILTAFKSFARAMGDDSWYDVVDACRRAARRIQRRYSRRTGLLPDFMVDCDPLSSCRPAPPYFLEGKYDGHYDYNAGRDPWRIATDYLISGDPESKAIVEKMMDWIQKRSKNRASRIKAGYRLGGKRIGNYTTTFFQSTFGVGAMIDAKYQKLLDSIYLAVRKRHEGYYEDSVTLLALLVMSGNFWAPEE